MIRGTGVRPRAVEDLSQLGKHCLALQQSWSMAVATGSATIADSWIYLVSHPSLEHCDNDATPGPCQNLKHPEDRWGRVPLLSRHVGTIVAGRATNE